MPTSKPSLSKTTGRHPFDWPLTGKLRQDVDAFLIGPSNFQTLVNFRYTADGIKGIQGMTPINASAIGYATLNSGYFYRKDNSLEYHTFVQGVSGAASILYMSNSTTSIPNQDTFSSFQTLENATTLRYSEAPNNGICAFNGITNRIWEGRQTSVGSFIVYDPAGSYWYDYTDQVNNTINDANNMATMWTVANPIPTGTQLLLHMNGANGGTTFTDSSSNGFAVTNVGGVVTDSWTYKFGGSSGFFNGVQYLTVPSNAAWQFGTSPFTISTWFNRAAAGVPNGICGQYQDSNNYWYLELATPAFGKITFHAVVSGTVIADYSAPWSNSNTSGWNHIALTRSGGNVYIFFNGISLPVTVNTSIGSASMPSLSAVLTIGTAYIGATCIGWVNEFTVVKGYALWTTNFTPPSTSYGTTSCSVYIGSVRPIQGLWLTVATANASVSACTVSQWTGSSWNVLAVTDGTASGGATLAKTGEITFPSTVSTSKLTMVRSAVAYFYQFVFSGISSGTQISHAAIDAPMQPVIDIWDGNGRTCLDCFFANGTVFTDFTSNVAASTSSNAKAYVASEPYTYAQFGSSTTASIYLAFASPEMGIQINIPDGLYINTIASILSINYWNGSAWTPVGNLIDNTSNNGASFGQSGTISWSPLPENTEFTTAFLPQKQTEFPVEGSGSSYGKQTLDANPWYYYQLSFSNVLSADVRVDTITGITSPLTIEPYLFSTLWQNRLWVFNDQAYMKNYGMCSNYGTNSVFNGSDSLTVQFGPHEIVCAGSIYSRYGSNIFDDLVVCSRNSTYMIDGTAPSNWTLYTISDKRGCVAPLTFVKCDLSFEVAQGITKHVLLWRTNNGIVFFDGNTIADISDDINNFFDTSKSDYIDPTIYNVSLETGGYDEASLEYHWIFTNANGKQEWVYSLLLKKWSQASRGTSPSNKVLNCVFTVQDTYGDTYLYGGDSNGFIERLDNGSTFDGNAITSTFRTGDILLAQTGSYITKLRYITLFAKAKNIATAKVACTYYPDANYAGMTLTPFSQANTLSRIYQGKNSIDSNATLHSLQYSITQSTETIGFEPLLISGLFEVDRENLY